MSNMNLPGQMPQGPPPPGAPGQPGVATDQAREALSLDRAMAVPFGILHDELMKPPEARDVLAMVKAKAMLMKIQAQRPQAPAPQPSGVTLTPQTGVPRPVDRQVDATTGMTPSSGPSYRP